MHHQKRKKKKSKKRAKRTSNRDWYHNAYDPTNPLTIYYAKYINKDKKV
tara:strand:+ start:306 stop:452 length:147 start_codon:yes stop_codon:yes gene_type:complete